MIVTKQWLNEFINISHLSTEDICKALNSLGLEVDSVQKVQIPDGIKIGFVEACEKHPDADKLSVCQVNLGAKTVQIVCGAKNVAVGQYVPVATIGTKLGEDFVIKPSILRGFDSNGMICSSTEIGLEKINDGILPLDNSIGELILGKELSEYPLLNDEIIEIELTPNRGDCLNIIGIAKELGAYYNLSLMELENCKIENSDAIGRILEVEYSTKTETNLIFKLTDIVSFSLPLLYKLRMAIIGISKKTDIELACGYCVHTTGVALNIYTKNIAQSSDEKIHLQIKDNENGFAEVIGNHPLSIVGIEGGEIEEIDTIVAIEASYIEPTTLAQKVFQTKQKTGDLYYRSGRGTNPNLQLGLDYFTTLLSKFGGKIFRGQLEFANEIASKIIDVNVKTVSQIIGQEVDSKTIETILTSLGFMQNKIHTSDVITFVIPNERHDIVNIADIAEEIVRLIGIDNIVPKPLAMDEKNETNLISKALIKKNKIRNRAVLSGFFETTTYIFSSYELLKKYRCTTVEEDLDILNPITSDLNSFRTTLILNLLQGVSLNQKSGFKSVGLFEIGKVFNKKREEGNKIGFIWSGNVAEESLQNNGKSKNIDFFGFASKIAHSIGEFRLEETEDIENDLLHPYQIARVIQNGRDIGYISKLHPTVAKDFDISDATFIGEIDFDGIENPFVLASEISKYQSVKRDLSIVVPQDLPYKKVANVIDSLNIEELKGYTLIDIYRDESLEDKESLTIKFVLQSKTKTLEEDDIVSIMNIILTNLRDKLNITLR